MATFVTPTSSLYKRVAVFIYLCIAVTALIIAISRHLPKSAAVAKYPKDFLSQ